MRRAVLALLLTGCSYDWTASGTAAGDAGHDAPQLDAPPLDASDASPSDASTESPVDAPPTDSSGGSDADGNTSDCPQLLQTAKNALAPALVCMPTMANVCKAQAQDWCGCTVYLADGTSAAYMDFVGKVAAFDSAGCRSTIFCPDTCSSASPGLCVVSDAAANYACFQ